MRFVRLKWFQPRLFPFFLNIRARRQRELRFNYFQSVAPNLGHTAPFGGWGGVEGGLLEALGIFDGFDFCLHSILQVTWNLEYAQLLLNSSELKISILGDPSRVQRKSVYSLLFRQAVANMY